MRRQWPRIVALVVLLLALACEAVVLFVPTTHLRARGQKPFEIKEFADGVPVGQTFWMSTDGLDAAELELAASTSVLLQLRCRLMTGASGHWIALYDWPTMVRLPKGRSRVRFDFKPIAASSNQIYQFQVQQLGVRPLDPNAAVARPIVSVMGSLDDSLDGGNVILGREQLVDRDLSFAAYGADSRFEAFRVHINPHLPRPLRSLVLQLTVLAVYNWALAVFAFHMVVQAPDRSET